MATEAEFWGREQTPGPAGDQTVPEAFAAAYERKRAHLVREALRHLCYDPECVATISLAVREGAHRLSQADDATLAKLGRMLR